MYLIIISDLDFHTEFSVDSTSKKRTSRRYFYSYRHQQETEALLAVCSDERDLFDIGLFMAYAVTKMFHCSDKDIARPLTFGWFGHKL